MQQRKLPSPKPKHRHFDEVFTIACPGSCRFYNFRCNQWIKKLRQNNNISVSLLLVRVQQTKIMNRGCNIPALWHFLLTQCGWATHSQYLNQCWFIVNRALENNFRWNLNENDKMYIRENQLNWFSRMYILSFSFKFHRKLFANAVRNMADAPPLKTPANSCTSVSCSKYQWMIKWIHIESLKRPNQTKIVVLFALHFFTYGRIIGIPGVDPTECFSKTSRSMDDVF